MDFFDFTERGLSGVDEATEELAKRTIGTAIEVHKHLGAGLPETVYRNALAHEFELRGLPYQTEVPVPVYYKGKLVGEGRLDILVDGVLIIELKVVESLTDTHRAQVIAYLQATGLQLGLLINYNVTVLREGIKRVIRTKE
jgi:GxxExxY protein